MAKRKTPAQPETRPRPTMRKIAAQAGVSPTTVAHVLNQTPGAYVAADTRQRVLDAAAALGYQEALLSQSIKAPLRHLGMAVSDTEHPQLRADAMEIFEGARQEAFRHDYITVLLPMTPEVRPNYSSSRGVQAIEQFHRTKLIDGFILDKSSFLNHAVRKLAASGVPIATVNGAPIRSGRSRVPVLSAIVDNHAGARLAVEHLTQLGHQRIALLTRPWTSFPKQYRPYQVAQIIDGYRDALHAAGLEFDSGLVTDADPWDRQITYDAVDRVLSLDPPPSAIFAADDAIALMANSLAPSIFG